MNDEPEMQGPISVVTFRNGASAKPLLILLTHGSELTPLARLSSFLRGDFPVRCLQLEEPSKSVSVENIARRYVDKLRALQPDGPYRLLGYGVVGLIVYEVAAQLIGADQRVEFIGLIDTPRPNNESRRGQQSAQTFSRLAGMTHRYCPQPLSAEVHLFNPDGAFAADGARAWRSLLNQKAIVNTIECPTELLFSEPNVQMLAGKVCEALDRAAKVKVRVPERDYSPLIAIQAGDLSAPAIFCVPGAGANVTSFMSLATALGSGNSIYGLQPRGLDGSLVPHSSISAAAEAYVSAVRSVQPGGPYRLVGHSFGGWVILEMAHRLLAAGERVEPLVVLDSECPSPRRASRRYSQIGALLKLAAILETASGHRLHLTRAQIEDVDRDAQLVLMERMKAAGLLTRANTLAVVRGMARVFSTNLNTPYVPTSTYPGHMLLVKAAEEVEHNSEDSEMEIDETLPENEWTDHVATVERIELPGNHMTLLKQPNIDAISQHLIRVWETWRHAIRKQGPRKLTS